MDRTGTTYTIPAYLCTALHRVLPQRYLNRANRTQGYHRLRVQSAVLPRSAQSDAATPHRRRAH
eukprot:2230242-Prymnesium_polylepis.1